MALPRWGILNCEKLGRARAKETAKWVISANNKDARPQITQTSLLPIDPLDEKKINIKYCEFEIFHCYNFELYQNLFHVNYFIAMLHRQAHPS